MAEHNPTREDLDPRFGHNGQAYYRGVASVPAAPPPSLSDTGDLPAFDPRVSPGPAGVRPGGQAGRRTTMAPARGMVVRRRWRRLRSGAGWTWPGVSFALVCWGIWVVSVRGAESVFGGDLVGPALALALVLVTGVLVFTVSQLLGRVVLEGVLGRERRSAWPSHLATGLFLVAAGVAFLQQTWWVVEAWNWLTDLLV